jgi:GTP-binding protein
MNFIDYAKIYIKSGDGGNGHISFRKEKFVPKGGPDGGNGGKGGDVIFYVDPHMNTLLDFKFKRHFKAENGVHGGKKRCTGAHGKDIKIKVPMGTLIKNVETDEIIADLTEVGSKFVAAKGGNGGFGNSEFATATNQAPRFAKDGLPGIEMEVILELKLIADVGLVGYPNVGKSTLISVISAAKPKIANYEFTTLVPNLGIVQIGDYKNYCVADIPGLIQGASEGKGLGIQFLRHVERTRVLLFMLDAMSHDPMEDYRVLENELITYNPDMNLKKRLVCFSKIDSVMEDTRQELKAMKFDEKVEDVFMISSITGENIDKVKMKMWQMIERIREEEEYS